MITTHTYENSCDLQWNGLTWADVVYRVEYRYRDGEVDFDRRDITILGCGWRPANPLGQQYPWLPIDLDRAMPPAVRDWLLDQIEADITANHLDDMREHAADDAPMVAFGDAADTAYDSLHAAE